MADTAAVLAAKPDEPMKVPDEIALVIDVIGPWRIGRLIIGTVDEVPTESEV